MAVRPSTPRAEYMSGNGWVGVAAPRLSWTTTSDRPGWLQAEAQLRITRGTDVIVSTVDGRASVLVDWPTTPLTPRQAATVEVRVRASDEQWSAWSDSLEIRGGFLGTGDWLGSLIGAADTAPKQPARLRRDVAVGEGLARATLYATAHGTYQAWINGHEVDDHVLKPGWTSYDLRLAHDTTDVTPLLSPGANVIGISLAGAWFTESYANDEGDRSHYGDVPAVSAQLVLEYDDGTTTTIATDGSWNATTDGPIVASGIYAGEHHDARRADVGWSTVGHPSAEWPLARVEGAPKTAPQAQIGPPVRRIEELPAREIVSAGAESVIVDFGQNLVGRLRIRVTGPEGHRITLRHAEVLEHGQLGVRPLRSAAATDSYTLAGTGEPEEWEPDFTFHGFRYAEITNWPGDVDPSDIVAVVLHSDMVRTGWFDSSHALINRLHENTVWGMRGNFLSIPTDCPQRDERLGWTGDILAFAPSASYLFDVRGFLASWLRDFRVEQSANGGIPPFVIPSVLEEDAAAAWGDAATVVPTVLRDRYNDLGLLRDSYDSMRAWCDIVLERAGDRHLWEDGFQFGDWLDPDAPPSHPGRGKTDPDLVATAFLHRSLTLTARAATELGFADDADRYRAESHLVRRAFLDEFATSSGRLVSDSQTAYALAIVFDLVDSDRQRQAFGDRLAYLTRSNGYRIGTGFVGTPLVQDALTDTGHADAAARLMTQTNKPSWLYPVTLGATTIWERWDSLLEDGTINPGEMTSFNHYALGSVVDWLHRRLAGLAAAEPGYRTISVDPLILPQFDWATATHDTPYGRASAGWKRDGDNVTITVLVPANATAAVALPGGRTVAVGSGEHAWTVAAPRLTGGDQAFTLDHSLADLIDDHAAYTLVLEAVAAHSPAHAEDLRDNTRWTPGMRIRDAFRYAPQPLIRHLEDALSRFRSASTIHATRGSATTVTVEASG